MRVERIGEVAGQGICGVVRVRVTPADGYHGIGK